MKKYLTLFVLLSVILVLSSLIVLAGGVDDQGNPNDPNENERANACFEGGSMEGKCGTNDYNKNGLVDDYEKDWDFTCGWHLIRFEYNMVNRENFPGYCAILLPVVAEIVYEGSGSTPVGGCVGPLVSFLNPGLLVSLNYADFGSSNTLAGTYTVYSDASCTTIVGDGTGFLVLATSGNQVALCSSIAVTLSPQENLGHNVWVCE